MPSSDPVVLFDDFILGHILSFVPAEDVVLAGYNVSKRWRAFYQRARVCRPVYLALPDVNEIDKVEMAHTDTPENVDWRALCTNPRWATC
ncbi:hypothetical protein Q8F55_008493 [Vanrija albida]|uniref:F-box domain-containing protein n=1 Tax=Vanrija albida TaxID=181172 RepID=A0ABR3PRA0_9TREE